jgi:hypothetical protein
VALVLERLRVLRIRREQDALDLVDVIEMVVVEHQEADVVDHLRHVGDGVLRGPERAGADDVRDLLVEARDRNERHCAVAGLDVGERELGAGADRSGPLLHLCADLAAGDTDPLRHDAVGLGGVRADDRAARQANGVARDHQAALVDDEKVGRNLLAGRAGGLGRLVAPVDHAADLRLGGGRHAQRLAVHLEIPERRRPAARHLLRHLEVDGELLERLAGAIRVDEVVQVVERGLHLLLDRVGDIGEAFRRLLADQVVVLVHGGVPAGRHGATEGVLELTDEAAELVHRLAHLTVGDRGPLDERRRDGGLGGGGLQLARHRGEELPRLEHARLEAAHVHLVRVDELLEVGGVGGQRGGRRGLLQLALQGGGGGLGGVDLGLEARAAGVEVRLLVGGLELVLAVVGHDPEDVRRVGERSGELGEELLGLVEPQRVERGLFLHLGLGAGEAGIGRHRRGVLERLEVVRALQANARARVHDPLATAAAGEAAHAFLLDRHPVAIEVGAFEAGPPEELDRLVDRLGQVPHELDEMPVRGGADLVHLRLDQVPGHADEVVRPGPRRLHLRHRVDVVDLAVVRVVGRQAELVDHVLGAVRGAHRRELGLAGDERVATAAGDERGRLLERALAVAAERGVAVVLVERLLGDDLAHLGRLADVLALDRLQGEELLRALVVQEVQRLTDRVRQRVRLFADLLDGVPLGLEVRFVGGELSLGDGDVGGELRSRGGGVGRLHRVDVGLERVYGLLRRRIVVVGAVDPAAFGGELVVPVEPLLDYLDIPGNWHA